MRPVDEILRDLRSIDERRRRSAAREIAAAGEAAVAPLCRFLRAETWEVKPAAAEALTHIARATHCCTLREAIPLLRKELRKVRWWLAFKEFGLSPGLFELFEKQRAAELERTMSTIRIYEVAIAEIERATASIAALPVAAQMLQHGANELPVSSDVVPALS